jgi:hypothetical protein
MYKLNNFLQNRSQQQKTKKPLLNNNVLSTSYKKRAFFSYLNKVKIMKYLSNKNPLYFGGRNLLLFEKFTLVSKQTFSSFSGKLLLRTYTFSSNKGTKFTTKLHKTNNNKKNYQM